MGYPYGMKGAPAIGNGAPGLPRGAEVRGELMFDIPGAHSIIVPEGVTTMCAVCVAGGGGPSANNHGGVFYHSTGAGAGLAWKNNIPVSPGDVVGVIVGAGGTGAASGIGAVGEDGGASYVIITSGSPLCMATGGGGGAEGVSALGGLLIVGDGGGSGGAGVIASTASSSLYTSGGAAAGYSGNGGVGVAGAVTLPGVGGTGGGGGSGSPGHASGGVGVFGEGASGAGGDGVNAAGRMGRSGSGGRPPRLSGTSNIGVPGEFGAGGSIYFTSIADMANGTDGCVRILWGAGRAFPSTDVGQG